MKVRFSLVEWRRVGLGAVVVACFVAPTTNAHAEEKRFGQEILEILREEGKIDDERYEELKAKEAAENAAQQEAQAAAAPNPKSFEVEYSNGLRFNRRDGQVKIKLGGRIQADFASIHVDGDLMNAPVLDGPGGAPTGDTIGGDGEGVELRRTRLYMSGELYDRIIFKSQFDFAGGDVTLNDQYIGMKNLPYVGTIKVGHMKQPYSLEELDSSNDITFMERSLPSVFDSKRDFGLMVQNHFLDQRMTAALGIFAATDDGGEFFSRETNFDVSGRVTGLPYYHEDEKRLVHLGFSLVQRIADSQTTEFRQRPEMHLAQRYLNTGDFVIDGSSTIAAEFAAVCGPFSLQGEWKSRWTDRRDGNNWEADGAYVFVSYFLTGESRAYDTRSGKFDRLSPLSPFNPGAGDWGAFEVGARYSWIDLQDEGMNGGEEQNVTLALNWYLFSNVMLRANYVYADVKDTGDVLSNASGDIHTFQARAQITF